MSSTVSSHHAPERDLQTVPGPDALERGSATRPNREPVYVPAEWAPAPRRERDVALDMLRGLAMVILVVNHTRLDAALGHATGAVLSAAEVLVSVSGIVVGMVFGRRWIEDGARATTAMLLRRARKLYLASVVVVVLVGAATLVPGLATDALTVAPDGTAGDLYAFDDVMRTALAVVTLEAGPWQFNILGFFVAGLAVAPVVLWLLARGLWPAVLVTSLVAFVVGRETGIEVLPSQSERPFPLLVWQLPFVAGMVVGWHRDRVAAWLSRHRRRVIPALLAAAATFAAIRIAGPQLADPGAWRAWEMENFDKRSLDPLRIAAMASVAGAAYLGLRALGPAARAAAGRLLLPLGRNSFYVFIVHVFICLGLASIPAIAQDGGLGLVGNSAVQVGCLALVCAMVNRRFLFRWIPR